MRRLPTGGALVVAGLATLGMGWAARPAGDGFEGRLAYVGLHLLVFGGLVAWSRTADVSRTGVLVGAVVLRLLALPMGPTLSDDGYRYLWDGLLASEGVSPYASPPSDEALSAYHADPLYARLNSPEYPSVYPPASQWVFWLGGEAYRELGFDAGWTALKGVLVATELVGILCLLRVARPSRVLVYAWSPLAVVEIAGQGHTEALVVAGLGLLVGGWGRAWPLRSLGVTIAGLAKLYPLALLPQAWRRDGPWGPVVTLVTLAALAAPVWHPAALANVADAVGLFYGTLDWFSAPYLGLKAVLYPVFGDAASAAASRALAVGFVAAVTVAAITDDGTRRTLVSGAAVGAAAAVLSVATLHPWYTLPVLFMAPLLKPKYWVVVLSVMPTLGYLSYEAESAGALGVLVLGWGALVLAVVADARRGRLWPRRDGVQDVLS